MPTVPTMYLLIHRLYAADAPVPLERLFQEFREQHGRSPAAVRSALHQRLGAFFGKQNGGEGLAYFIHPDYRSKIEGGEDELPPLTGARRVNHRPTNSHQLEHPGNISNQIIRTLHSQPFPMPMCILAELMEERFGVPMPLVEQALRRNLGRFYDRVPADEPGEWSYFIKRDAVEELRRRRVIGEPPEPWQGPAMAGWSCGRNPNPNPTKSNGTDSKQ